MTSCFGRTVKSLKVPILISLLLMWPKDANVSLAQDRAVAKAVYKEANGLRVGLSARKSMLVLGEPLVLEIVIKNTSGSPLKIHGPLRQQAASFFLHCSFVHRETDGTGTFESGVWDCFASGYPLTLAPGETIECPYWFGSQLSASLNRAKLGLPEGNDYVWALPLPGTYDVRVTFSLHANRRKEGFWKGHIMTDPITIEVAAPADLRARNALDVWTSAQSDLAMRGRRITMNRRLRDQRAECLRACKEVVALYDDTIYAPWAGYLIALLEQPPAARVTALEAFVRSHPSFTLVDEALYELAQDAKEANLDASARLATAVQGNPRHVARVDDYRDRW
jgi:hypothetical protein